RPPTRHRRGRRSGHRPTRSPCRGTCAVTSSRRGTRHLSCLLVSAVWDRVAFTCNGEPVDLEVAPGESLLSVLREHLRMVSVKDGCAPQGQCGCCTVLVDGDPRVACVAPAVRVAGRAVTTLEAR